MANKLLNFLQQNKEIGQPIRVDVSKAKNEATIWLYDVISDFWGISAKDFNKELMNIDADVINLRINSPGGDIYEARAIQTALASSGKKINVYIDGLAASAATYIALVGDKRYMADGAWFMIHNAWTLIAGDKNALSEEALMLDRIDASIAKDYIKATGASEEDIKEWMDNETWFDADEALEHGFITDIVDNIPVQENMWNLSQYMNVPQALIMKPQANANKQKFKKELNMENENKAKLNELEEKLRAAEERAQASEAKMAEYEARVENMARDAFKKDLVSNIGAKEADTIMPLYGHVDSAAIQNIVDLIKGYQDKLNTVGAPQGSDEVDIDVDNTVAFADVKKYAQENGISFMEANKILHNKE